jgi:GNAT superfamily N-acetyltransferase
MREIHQEGVNARVLELEDCGVETWPARETRTIAGWVARLTDGFTHRGNSVATQRFAWGHCDDAVDIVEQTYAERDLPPMFQISPVSHPGDLIRTLKARGYRTITPTLTCTASTVLARAVLPEPRAVRAGGEPDDDFAQLIVTGSRSPGDGRERLDILSRVELPLVCVTAYNKGIPVACGTGTLIAGWVGINMMRTDADHRRSGHAQRVLSAITHWAESKGVSRLYLNVEEGNHGARALYTKAGFETAYAYSYAVRD